jgi:Domain of unknown function (DUF397)
MNRAACVQAAHVPGAVAVRDTKDPAGPRLAEWAAFTRRLRDR